MRGGAEHAETTGAADGCHHVAAVAERQQGEFNSQHVADRRFHGFVCSPRQRLALLIIGLNDEFSNDASASWAGKPSGPSSLSPLCVAKRGERLVQRIP